MNTGADRDLDSPRVHISVVAPVYGCAPCLPDLCRRLQLTIERLTASFEVILVDDHSPDEAWRSICRMADEYPWLRGVRLSRNFGQHAAIAAGLQMSRGEWIAVLDCDLQDPPEVIAALYERARDGADIVFARRRRGAEGWLRRVVSRTYFRLLNALGDLPLDGREGALTLFSRRVAEVYLSFAEPDRHHVMLLRWVGFRQDTVDYDRAPRLTGRSAYHLTTLIDSAIGGVLFSSARLLRIVLYAGLACAGVGFALALALIARAVVSYTAPGWASLIVVELIVGGGIMVSLGVVGLYVGRMFEQSRRRPLFLIAQTTDKGGDEIRDGRPSRPDGPT